MSIRTQMTTKQTRFVAEYLVDGNGSRAAVAAGYGRAGARVTACRTLAIPNVREAIAARQGVDAKRLEIARQDVLKGLLAAVEQAKEQGNPAAMISGWREIGRMLGFYEPGVTRVELSAGQRDTPRRLNHLTDAELLKIVAGGQAAGYPQ